MRLRLISVPALIAEAGGDPWAINRSLQAGSPSEISDLAEAFHRAGGCTRDANEAFERARERFGAAWNPQGGGHPINDSAEVRRVIRALGAQSLQLPKIGADLKNVAAALAEAQGAQAGEIARLEAQLQELDDVIVQAVETQRGGATDEAALDALIRACEDDAIDGTKAALAQSKSLRSRYSATLQKSLGHLGADGYDPSSPRQADAGTQIPAAGAEDVHRWWTSLTAQQRRRFIAENPDQIGNLNGVPILARNAANTVVLARDLERVRDTARRSGVAVDDVLRDPARYGLAAADVTRYRNADEVSGGLDHDAADAQHPNPVYLFAYDPVAFGGKGRAAIAIGNPDTAKNTAVIVPGTNSSVRGGWLHDGHNDALSLFAQANAADPDHRTAVIAWMGYDAPDRPSDAQRISTPHLARAGGAALARDVNGLWATHLGGDQHVTALGHSYGSTTVADAFAVHGMRANDAVLLGCPGTDAAKSAADFHLDGGHVFVGDASTDPVGMIGQLDGLSRHFFGGDILGQLTGTDPGLGADPAVDGFGSVRFRAEVPGSGGVDPRAHSHYYAPGSEALHSMAHIVSGHGDALEADGLTAQHRRRAGAIQIRIPGLPPVTLGPRTPAIYDPEWNRPPGSITDDHFFDGRHRD